MELRAKIARIVFDARGSTKWTQAIGGKCGEAADAILALPEIRCPREFCKEVANGPGHGDMNLLAVCAQNALDGNEEPFVWA